MNSQVDKIYFKIFQKHFPDIKTEDVTAYFEGNDHKVFVIKNQTAFRFPKSPREIDAKRSAFLKQLAPISPLPLPLIEVHTDEDSGIYYETNAFIPGVSFYPPVVDMFSKTELITIAKQLGEFLSAIHSFPVTKARELALDEMDSTDFWEYMEQNPQAYPKFKSIVLPHVTKDEQVWIEKLFTDYIALIRATPFKTRVTHSDMWTYHIIVDTEKRRLSGVIDFWGRIADPANDFKAFEYYGEDFVKEVYKHYSLPIDENFDQRRLFYTGYSSISSPFVIFTAAKTPRPAFLILELSM